MNDSYLYPSTNVSRNKLDIMDAQKLAEAENEIVYNKLIEVDAFSGKKTFDVQYLKDLHNYLFCDIYDWAGQFRTISICKQERELNCRSVGYADTYSHINEYDVTKYHYKPFNEQKRER